MSVFTLYFIVMACGTDHAIYCRMVEGKRYSAPVQMGKKTLDPVYCKRVLRQLKFEDAEIVHLLT